MSTGAIIWSAYGVATLVAVLVFRRHALKRHISFDWLDAVICAIGWPFFLIIGIFGEPDQEAKKPGDSDGDAER